MTDKVQKIREEVEIVVNRRLNLLNGDYFDLNKEVDGFTNEIMDIIVPLQEEPISEEFNAMCLDENGNPTLAKETDFTRGFVKGAQWQKQKDNASVSDDLEEAANNALNNVLNSHEIVNVGSCLEMFRFGANWQKQQDQETIELAEDHAMLAGMNKMEQQMMAKAINAKCFGFQGAALFSFRLPADNYLVGSEVKVIVVKDN